VHDICERISSVGFEVQILKKTLSGLQVISSPVVYAVKR
jgi:hypothetical protein